MTGNPASETPEGPMAIAAPAQARKPARPSSSARANAAWAAVSASEGNGVAVIIAAWRASGTIARAVRSALAQPEAVEVIVVDDASGDDGATLAAASSADDNTGRLRILALPVNGGPSRARNAALEIVTAPWLTVLDADDFMLPGRLGQLLGLAAPDLDFIADDLFQVAEGKEDGPRRNLWFRGDASTTSLSYEDFIRANIPQRSRHHAELGFLKPLMRRAFLDRRRLRYDESMRLGEDYDLYVRALADGAGFLLAPATGYVSVIRAGSLSDATGRTELETLLACDDRLLAHTPMTRSEQRALMAHRAVTERKIAWIDFIDALKTMRLPRALAILFANPQQALHITRGLWLIVQRRATGGKKPAKAV
jgi:succinoglycan biosynthesis protein ExoU